MNKLESVKFSNVELEQEVVKGREGILDYCEVCFIALGSQEDRIFKGNKAFHLDCVKKLK